MRLANLGQFPLSSHHALAAESQLRYYWEQGLYLASLRAYRPYFAHVVRQQRPDLVHSHFGSTGWEMSQGSFPRDAKHVVSFYGFDAMYLPRQNPAWQARYRDLFRNVDRVLCEAPHMARCVAELGGDPEKVQVHRLGVPVEAIEFRPRALQTGETLRVLLAGSFQEKKGIPNAIEAVGKAMRDIPIELTIIGDANTRQARSRAEKTRIMAALEKWKLLDKARMLGFQSHDVLMREAYQHHVYLAACVSASDGDTEGGLPYTITEFVASGMLIVSTRHCDIPEIVHEGVTGLLADERDSDGLAQHLCWLASNPSSWADMINAGHALVKTEFNARIQGLRLADIYASVVGQ